MRSLLAMLLVLAPVPALACIQSAQSEPTFTEVCIASICTRIQPPL
jgi:hypothetical protein